MVDIGTLRLGANTTMQVICPDFDAQYGLRVSTYGKFYADGQSAGLRNCYFSKLGTYRTYIYLYRCEAYLRYMDISGVGNADGSGLSVQAEDIDGSLTGRGLLIKECSLYNSSLGIRVDGVKNNTAPALGILDNYIYNTQRGYWLGSNNTTTSFTFLPFEGLSDSAMVIGGAGSQLTLPATTITASGTSAGLRVRPTTGAEQAITFTSLTIAASGSAIGVVGDGGSGNTVITAQTAAPTAATRVIFGGNYGISITNATGITLSNFTITNSSIYCIYLGDGANNNVINVSMTGRGIQLLNATGNIISGIGTAGLLSGITINTGDYGITMTNSSGNLLRGITITGTTFIDGIFVEGGSGNTFGESVPAIRPITLTGISGAGAGRHSMNIRGANNNMT
ncbi:MAG: right-handed parallel beta-helix repeat-containing protein, partial [Planctomycetota bacterium]|nr:right-handed parallel beta-helix repeat-containing protein [Planctomycetota bacterium]